MNKNNHKKLKLIFITIVGLLFVAVFVAIINHPYLHNIKQTHEIILRMDNSANIEGSVGWSGGKLSPVTHNFAYTDISDIPVSILEEDIITSTETMNNDWSKIEKLHSLDTLFYVELIKYKNNKWYEPKFVTTQKENVEGKIFITGKLEGWGGEPSKLLMRYPGIDNSQDILPLTDFFGIYSSLGDRTAVVGLDKNGNSQLQTILIDDNICATRGNVDFSDSQCWSDTSTQRIDEKKYSTRKGNLYLLRKSFKQNK